jgi:hypothetical protein
MFHVQEFHIQNEHIWNCLSIPNPLDVTSTNLASSPASLITASHAAFWPHGCTTHDNWSDVLNSTSGKHMWNAYNTY